jgi:hypothetical protein
VKERELAELIRKAFADVRKGEGIGVREANALDDYADRETRAAARAADVEQCWWEVPEEVRKNSLGSVLSFTDAAGFRFLLPLLMTAAIGGDDMAESSVEFHLCCLLPGERSPHHGHPEYVEFLRKIRAAAVADAKGLDGPQRHAVGRFLDWSMASGQTYLYADPERERLGRERSHEMYRRHAGPGNYTLSLEDVHAIWREECRIREEWTRF